MSATQLSVIADAGSTKTDWILADAAGNILRECRTGGLNAISASEAEMHAAFSEAARLLDAPEAPVFFYGAGCARPTSAAGWSVLLRVQGSLPGHLPVPICSVPQERSAATRRA